MKFSLLIVLSMVLISSTANCSYQFKIDPITPNMGDRTARRADAERSINNYALFQVAMKLCAFIEGRHKKGDLSVPSVDFEPCINSQTADGLVLQTRVGSFYGLVEATVPCMLLTPWGEHYLGQGDNNFLKIGERIKLQKLDTPAWESYFAVTEFDGESLPRASMFKDEKENLSPSEQNSAQKIFKERYLKEASVNQ